MDGSEIWSLQPTGDDRPLKGSVGVADGLVYQMGYDGDIYVINSTGDIVLSFDTIRSGDSFWSNFFTPESHTPTIVGEKLWIGGTNNRLRAYNITDGAVLYSGIQPNVAGENSHGAAVFVPDWGVTAVNQSDGSSVGSSDGKIVTQAGPTMVMATADDGSNIWSNWGGWEIWSTPVYSGLRNSALVYYGSDSGGLTVVNASNGVALSWFTARGNIVSSCAVWDGKLYVGSYDNKLYCFEDRNVQEMAISISTDRNQMDVGDSVTVTLQLTKIPDINVYEEIGRAAKVPGLPDADVLVTFTKPDGVTEVTRGATTDKLGWASVTFAPDAAGTWKIITWYEGEDRATFAYDYAFSDEATVDVTGGAEPTPTPTPTPTASEIPMEYVWAAVAVVVIVVVVLVVLLFLRRR
jgi:hypothetical protein